jgi:hypothetical protein
MAAEAEAVVKLFNARPAGPRRWLALCPAHDDRIPSPSICDGRDCQRIMLKCWAGCSIESVLKSAGLGWFALFIETQEPVQATRTIHARAAREGGWRRWHVIHAESCERTLRYARIADELASHLARMMNAAPEGDELTRLFHSVLGRLRAAETALDALELR